MVAGQPEPDSQKKKKDQISQIYKFTSKSDIYGTILQGIDSVLLIPAPIIAAERVVMASL
jgi:hypothetical protein